MVAFYKPYKRRSLTRALKKLGLDTKEGRKHTKVECAHNGKIITIPRHTTIWSETMDVIYKYLLDKFQKKKIEKLLKIK